MTTGDRGKAVFCGNASMQAAEARYAAFRVKVAHGAAGPHGSEADPAAGAGAAPVHPMSGYAVERLPSCESSKSRPLSSAAEVQQFVDAKLAAAHITLNPSQLEFVNYCVSWHAERSRHTPVPGCAVRTRASFNSWAASNKLRACMLGGPGTGKTYVANALELLLPHDTIRYSATTGTEYWSLAGMTTIAYKQRFQSAREYFCHSCLQFTLHHLKNAALWSQHTGRRCCWSTAQRRDHIWTDQRGTKDRGQSKTVQRKSFQGPWRRPIR